MKPTLKIASKDSKWNKLKWYQPAPNSMIANFFSHSSLHGLKYVGQRDKHFCERYNTNSRKLRIFRVIKNYITTFMFRIFWILSFVISTFFALIFIFKMIFKYHETPIVTVFSPEVTTINQIPFPAITICNVNYVQKSKADQVMR